MEKRTLEAFEMELLADIEHVCKEFWINNVTSNTPWTEAIKNCFASHAERSSCDCRSSLRGHGGEFLWDVTWTEPRNAGPYEQWKVKLACEVEWNTGRAALDDFRKLIHSRAEYLVMIFDGEMPYRNGEDVYGKKLEEMKKHIVSGTGQKYLFIGLRYDLATDSRPPRDTSRLIVEHEQFLA